MSKSLFLGSLRRIMTIRKQFICNSQQYLSADEKGSDVEI